MSRLMLQYLWTLLKGLAARLASPEYRAFTTWFDVEVRAERLLKKTGLVGELRLRKYSAAFDQAMLDWGAAANLAAINAGARVRAEIGDEILKDTVASLLIDHSGSMKGQRAILAVALTEIVTDL